MDPDPPPLPQDSPSGRALSTAPPTLSSLQCNSANQRAEQCPKSHSGSRPRVEQEGETPPSTELSPQAHPSPGVSEAGCEQRKALLFLLTAAPSQSQSCAAQPQPGASRSSTALPTQLPQESSTQGCTEPGLGTPLQPEGGQTRALGHLWGAHTLHHRG